MLALVLDGNARVVTNHPDPARAPGEALVRIQKAGVCDTDLQLARGYMAFRGVPGHEFVGTVLEADDAAWVGRRVVADINAGCGACAECRAHGGHHCAARSVLGIVRRGGAFAERAVVPERCLVAVPDRVTDDQAVFAEPIAAAAHVLDAVSDRDLSSAIVVGDGKLGLLIARALGAGGLDVTVIGHHREKLALAERAGQKVLLESDVEAKTKSPLVVEATGSAKGLAFALSLTAPRGTLVLKTTVADPVPVDLSPAVIDEIRIVGSRCGDMQKAVDLLAERRLDPSDLIAARYPLRRADEALARAATPGTLKVLIESD